MTQTQDPTSSSSSICSRSGAYYSRLERTVLKNPWNPHQPTPRQTYFLYLDDVEEVLYGGAAGGGKSDALLMAALQDVDKPGYSALILRRTFKQLAKADAIMDRSKQWLKNTGADWSEDRKTWTFPSGAKLEFGHMEHEDDKYNYQGPAYQFIGFDEVTQFTETQYLYLFSRRRRGVDLDVPLRTRATAMPGGPGHEWVKKRFISDEFLRASEEERFTRVWPKGKRWFVPARLEDNKHLDRESYERGLEELDPVTRAQVRKGDWQAHADGRFKREWFVRYRDLGDAWQLMDSGFILKKESAHKVCTCDPANRKTKASKYTAIGVFANAGLQRTLVLDVVREQMQLQEIVPRLNVVCVRWRPSWVGIEANGFQIGLCNEARDRARHPAIPTVYELDPEGKSKLTRATPAILRAEHGRIYIPQEAPWLEDWLAEHCSFTGDDREDATSDMVDCTAYAINGIDRFGAGGDDSPGGGRRRGQ